MKRIWIGIGLLTVVLASGLWASSFMERTHTAIAMDLDRAAQLVQEGQWEGAQSLIDRAEENWKNSRSVTACFAEHQPLDEIDGLLAQLKIFAAARDEISCGANCAYLSQRLHALGKCHKFTLWNLL